MSKFLTLREAGLDYPEMEILRQVTHRLSGPNKFPIVLYGGYLRDLVLLGHTRSTGDIDAAMRVNDFLALKPQEEGTTDLRRHFVLHEPHLLFMLHQIQDGVFQNNSRPAVLTLKCDVMSEWGLSMPLGLTLTRDVTPPFELVADADLAFSEIVSDGNEIWVSPAFIQDQQNRTISLRRCRNMRDYERTMRRIQRFISERYIGWQFVVPDEFREFMPS